MASIAPYYRDPDEDASWHQRKRDARGYRPLDEKLASTRVRLLRAIVHCGPCEWRELAVALDIALPQLNKREDDSFHQALKRLVQRKEVRFTLRAWRLTCSPFTVAHERVYSVTAKGKRALVRELRVDRKVIE